MSWEIIKFGFKGGDKFYIGTTKYGSQRVEDKIREGRIRQNIS